MGLEKIVNSVEPPPWSINKLFDVGFKLDKPEGKIDGDDDTANAIISYIEDNITNIDDQKIYFDHGTVGLDSLYSTPQRRVNKILDSKSKDYKYLVFDGYDHYAPEFGSRFDSVLEYLVIN